METNSSNAFAGRAAYAADNGKQMEAIKLLAAAKADLNQPNTQGWTPLHRATDLNLPGMVALLIQLGANPQIPNGDGQTPLFFAVQNNNQTLVAQLIKCCLDPNVADRFGATPLMLDSDSGIFRSSSAFARSSSSGLTGLFCISSRLRFTMALARAVLDGSHAYSTTYRPRVWSTSKYEDTW